MTSRTLSIIALHALVACGPSVPTTPTAPSTRAVDPPRDEAPIEQPADVAVPEPEPEPEIVDLGPIDHSQLPCFSASEPLRYALPPVEGGGRRVTVRSSARIAPSGEIHARPRDVIRIEVTLENTGEAFVLTEQVIASMQQLVAWDSYARWTTLTRAAGDLHAGNRLERGAALRLCLAFDVGDSPITAAPSHDGNLRAYTLSWGAFGPFAQQVIVVRYASPRRAPSVREPESWGGVIALRLRPGADLLALARATGVRIGSAVPPFVGRPEQYPPRRVDEPEPTAPHAYVEAPPHFRVHDVVLALTAHPDVESATALMRGDPGTEGCSEYSPCARGESCCYMCGIEGCPNSCYAGSSCPGGIP